MLFAGRKIVFVHVPKTAGNYVTAQLLPYSDDKMVLSGHQDGKERFEVTGPVTRAKHQTVPQYVQALGDSAADYRFFATYRPPVERMLSFYFSPHRWMVRTPDGTFQHKPVTTLRFDLGEFEDFIVQQASFSEVLDMDQTEPVQGNPLFRRHTSGALVHVLRYRNLQADLVQLSDACGLDQFEWASERRNVSQVDKQTFLDENALLAVERTVMSSRHARDIEYGFEDCPRQAQSHRVTQ